MDMKSSAFWAQRSRSHEAEDRFGSITLDPFEWSIAFLCSLTVHSVKIDTVYTTKSYGRFLDLLFHLVCLHTQRSEYICLSEALADQSTPRQSPPLCHNPLVNCTTSSRQTVRFWSTVPFFVLCGSFRVRTPPCRSDRVRSIRVSMFSKNSPLGSEFCSYGSQKRG